MLLCAGAAQPAVAVRAEDVCRPLLLALRAVLEAESPKLVIVSPLGLADVCNKCSRGQGPLQKEASKNWAQEWLGTLSPIGNSYVDC